jgi:hypothetical protein
LTKHIEVKGVGSLAGSCKDTLYVVGSGPSVDDFPLERLAGRVSVALNHAVDLFEPAFWLYGDPKFGRSAASKIVRRRAPLCIVTNEKLLKWIKPHLKPGSVVYTFENHSGKGPDFLAGRWTVATIALSLASLMGAWRVVLVGVDMGAPNGQFYSRSLANRPPAKQLDFMGEWRKWMRKGFKAGIWSLQVETTSPYLLENCPDLPITEVDVREALA